MFKKLSAGIKYNRLLSREKVFYIIYPEFKVRDFLDYGKWYLPPLLAASLVMIYCFRFQLIHLIGLIITPCFIVIMLLLLYLHQGRQALRTLNEAEYRLYQELCSSNDHSAVAGAKRIDLMVEINLALSKGNRDFLDRI